MGQLFAARLRRAGYDAPLLHRLSPPIHTAPILLLVATKTPDVLTALSRYVHGAGHGQLALLLQNGMGTADTVRAHWPALRIWSAVTTAAAWRDDTGALHVVTEGDTQAGLHDDAGDDTLDQHIHRLASVGILRISADVRAAQWQKLAVNALINPLSALLNCRNGELAALAAESLRELAREFDAIAHAEGQTLDSLTLATEVMQKTASNFSSMNRDFAAGRPTEIDAITGFLIARAQRHGIPAPAHARLLAAIQTRRKS